MFRAENLLKIKASIAHPTKVIISVRIIIAWSWNIISWVIVEEHESWNLSCPHIII